MIAGCLAVGLGSGLGLIYVLDILDDRFRSPEEMRSQLNVPVLAMVRQMDDLNATGLENIHAYVAPDAATSESFRTLRATLAFSGQETSRLVVSSADRGTARQPCWRTWRSRSIRPASGTLLVDADLRRPGLTAQMGLKGQAGLSEILASDDSVAEAAMAHVRGLAVGFDFLPAGGRRPIRPSRFPRAVPDRAIKQVVPLIDDFRFPGSAPLRRLRAEPNRS